MPFLISFLASLYRKLVMGSGGSSGSGGDNGRNVKWVDGLRGMASFLVLLTHLARAFDYNLFNARDTEDGPIRLLQHPVLRIPWQGRIGVTIFAFLTGYVCALKPLRLSRAGNHNTAFSSIAKSAFRRPIRLIMPATIALVLSWTIAQFGAFTVGRRCDSGWLRFSSVSVNPSFLHEVKRLFRVFLATWTNGHMDYDDHQWALLPLLKGSMMVYVTLVATMYVQYRYRMLVYVGMYMYFWQNPAADTETFGQQFYLGMFLSDMANHQPTQSFISSRRWTRMIVCLVLASIGLFVASYPTHHAEWCGWSNFLLQLSKYIFPRETNLGKRYTALGVDLVILSIYLSPSTKALLSKPFFLWLGRNSFAVYLTHGTLLRTVLVWMIYGISGQPWKEWKNDKGEMEHSPFLPRGSGLNFAISIPTWFVLVYIVAHYWTTYVDSFCARMTQKLENFVFEQTEKSPMNGLPM
ncbi:Acyltransferase family protein [Coccidioides posadasii C735 delta SOWgp]|nr:Acyltransferase family protein [Coccidioides posadasii C735 delta SOWgp]EER23067.1 Acyltransferase family protein [Coccidioides posadasii C735 delta SOWgp]|eukprot:XP_003065212.1 Acyltransferase family protein [Coccidioides posadasii C735 delta SOWgp]